MKIFQQKGITVIEMLIALAVLMILLVAVLPQFSAMKYNQLLKNAKENVITVLNTARNQTLASLNSSEYGVHFQPDKVVLFTGTSYSSSDARNISTNIISPASISTFNLTGGATELYFQRLTGTPNVSGNIVVSVGSSSKTITITAAGAVGSD